jgi:hypothetical protein
MLHIHACNKCIPSVSDVSCACCKCFIWMLHMFWNDFQAFFRCLSVSDVHCKCFSCYGRMLQVLRMYVISISSGCCKTRSGIAHVAIGHTCHSCWGAAEQAQTVPRACAWKAERVQAISRAQSGDTSNVRAVWAPEQARARATGICLTAER